MLHDELLSCTLAHIDPIMSSLGWGCEELMAPAPTMLVLQEHAVEQSGPGTRLKALEDECLMIEGEVPATHCKCSTAYGDQSKRCRERKRRASATRGHLRRMRAQTEAFLQEVP